MFIDMVRVDHLKTYNSDAKECCLDRRLAEIGGTIYTRCFSPGPDTPRSMACMQSGLYPFFNGCSTRIRWPFYFLKEGISTIWDHAAEKKMIVNLCCNKNESLTGFFKYEESKSIREFHTPEAFFKEDNFGSDSISFIGIPDMHTAIGDYKATNYAFQKGDEIVDLYFTRYLTKEFISRFDYTFIFSDHGCQLEYEKRKMRSTLDLLDDGRCQLLLFIHKAGDMGGVRKDSRLASIVDLYATLEQLINGLDFRQGFSLFDRPQREYVHIEDHKDFNVYPEIMVKQWRIVTNTYDIRTDVDSTVISKGKESDVASMEAILDSCSPFFADYVKQLKVLEYYKKLNNDVDNYYFMGRRRASVASLFPIKVLVKFRYFLSRIRLTFS